MVSKWRAPVGALARNSPAFTLLTHMPCSRSAPTHGPVLPEPVLPRQCALPKS